MTAPIRPEYGKQYVTRNGLVTSPMTRSRCGTNYKYQAEIQEPQYPDPTVWGRLETGWALVPGDPHRLDLESEYLF